MKTEEYYKQKKPWLWDSDLPQEDEGYYGKDDMIEFAKQYAQSKIKEKDEEIAEMKQCLAKIEGIAEISIAFLTSNNKT